MDLSQFPSEIRLKLEEEAEEQFWKQVEKEGIANYSDKFSYNTSQFYNWKNKDVFLPVNVVKKTLTDQKDLNDKIIAYKGPGRSKAIKNPEIPVPKNNELLTRIESSVSLSKDTPIYQVKDRGLIERFIQLLESLGDVPHKVYNRSTVYELRYPRYLHRTLQNMNYEKNFAALVDEKGQIKDEIIEANGTQKNIKNFEEELYSRNKALKLALAKGNDQKVRRIMAKEAEKVKETFN